MTGSRAPIRVAVVNDYELVVLGLAALLHPYRDRVEVVEVVSGLGVLSEVDVVLYDTFGQAQGARLDIGQLTDSGSTKVVVYSWNIEQEVLHATVARGASGYLSKATGASELVEALEKVVAGEIVLPHDVPHDGPHGEVGPDVAWPGKGAGLTGRESEIIALITQGLSNQEIADVSFLSINSVKTYIRTAYRKIGVTRRAQAVLWGVGHGFEPEALRRIHQISAGPS